MKKLLILMTLLSTTAAFADYPKKTLTCTTGKKFESLELNLEEHPGFVPADHSYLVQDAWITDNYAHAHLMCTGGRLEEITCVGFWFDNPKEIVEVSVRKVDDKLASTYRPLVGKISLHVQPWTCELN